MCLNEDNPLYSHGKAVYDLFNSKRHCIITMYVIEPRVILYLWHAQYHRKELSTEEDTCCAQKQLIISDGVKMKCNVMHAVKG